MVGVVVITPRLEAMVGTPAALTLEKAVSSLD
jgi:hypothetical protein